MFELRTNSDAKAPLVDAPDKKLDPGLLNSAKLGTRLVCSLIHIIWAEAHGKEFADCLHFISLPIVLFVEHIYRHFRATEFPDELPAHATRACRRRDISAHGKSTNLWHFWSLETSHVGCNGTTLGTNTNWCRGDFDIGTCEEFTVGDKYGSTNTKIRVRAWQDK